VAEHAGRPLRVQLPYKRYKDEITLDVAEPDQPARAEERSLPFETSSARHAYPTVPTRTATAPLTGYNITSLTRRPSRASCATTCARAGRFSSARASVSDPRDCPLGLRLARLSRAAAPPAALTGSACSSQTARIANARSRRPGFVRSTGPCFRQRARRSRATLQEATAKPRTRETASAR
jgi:hypothetical protein